MTDISSETMSVGFRYIRLLRRQTMAIQKKYGLQGIDVSVLALLVRKSCGSHCPLKGDTLKDITEVGMFRKTHISQSLSRLLGKGYITMERDTEDRRFVHNLPTDKGRALIKEEQEACHEMNRNLMRGFSDEELETFGRLMGRGAAQNCGGRRLTHAANAWKNEEKLRLDPPDLRTSLPAGGL